MAIPAAKQRVGRFAVDDPAGRRIELEAVVDLRGDVAQEQKLRRRRGVIKEPLKYEIVGTKDLPRLPLHDHGYGVRSAEEADPKLNHYYCCARDDYSSPSGLRPVHHSSGKGEQAGWMLISAGPDKDYDILPRRVYGAHLDTATENRGQLFMSLRLTLKA